MKKKLINRVKSSSSKSHINRVNPLAWCVFEFEKPSPSLWRSCWRRSVNLFVLHSSTTASSKVSCAVLRVGLKMSTSDDHLPSSWWHLSITSKKSFKGIPSRNWMKSSNTNKRAVLFDTFLLGQQASNQLSIYFVRMQR